MRKSNATLYRRNSPSSKSATKMKAAAEYRSVDYGTTEARGRISMRKGQTAQKTT